MDKDIVNTLNFSILFIYKDIPILHGFVCLLLIENVCAVSIVVM